MSNNKRDLYIKAPVGYEAKLVLALQRAAQVGLCADNFQEHIFVFNDLYEAAYEYIERIVLSRYRSWLESYQVDPSEVANTVAQYQFWKRLDYIMAIADDPERCRRSIYKKARLCVYDSIRSARCVQNAAPLDDDALEADMQMACGEETPEERRYTTTNVHMTDVGWNMVASNMDLEGECITRETWKEALDNLKQNESKRQVIAFLGTKVVGYKASELEAYCNTLREDAVLQLVLECTRIVFSWLPADYFKDAAFWFDDLDKENEDITATWISKASDRAKNKVRRSMCKTL